LHSKNLVFDTTPFSADTRDEYLRSGELQPEQEADLRSAGSIAQQVLKQLKEASSGATAAHALRLMDWQMQFMARMWARYAEQSKGLQASAVLSQPLMIPEKMKRVYAELQELSTDVIDVVLDKLPMPSELTPWEAILDFKADTEAQGYLQGLKVWMGEIARQKLTAAVANEKLEWLLFQHKKHLDVHKLSYRWGTLGGTFVATAEILENIVKIKWGKAAGAVVSIFDRRIELMKAELSNPAKEVAYIVKAQERFEG
jgi:hypothetical protein